MRTLGVTVLGLTCLVLPGAVLPPPVHGQEPAKPLLPPESTWNLRHDTLLDGVLKDPTPAPECTMTVHNNRIVATATKLKIKEYMTGEIVPGEGGGFPIVMLRKDWDKNSVVFYTGRLVGDGKKVVGTYVTNGGFSGDFELVMVKK